MKKLLLVLAVCLSLNGYTQGLTEETVKEIGELYLHEFGCDSILDIMPQMSFPKYSLGEPVRIITLDDFEDYIESCKDTITAVACGNGEFTIRDKEIVTVPQMENRGYSFYRKHIDIGIVLKTEYIFVKELLL